PLPGDGPRIKFYSGWKLQFLKLKYALSLLKYLARRKKYSLFFLKSLKLLGKEKVLKTKKIPKFGKYYYASVLRVPRWPSKSFDRMVAGGGLNFDAYGTPQNQQIDTVILAITRKCNYNCQHCYEHHNLAEEESVPIERWKTVIKILQQSGTSLFILSGGEPMLRFEGLLEILDSVDTGLSDFHVHTSGNGVTAERAALLKKYGITAAGIALDDFNPWEHDRVKGYSGAHHNAVQAIQNFREAGIFPYINLCLRKDLTRPGVLRKYFEYANGLNAGAISILEPKPCGTYIPVNSGDLLSREEREVVTTFYKEANLDKKYRNYPSVVYFQYYERPDIYGCLMGLSHFYINSLGNVQPCIFLPVSFGNIIDEDFQVIFKRMREAFPKPIKQPCPVVTHLGTRRRQSRKSLLKSQLKGN
ncbi:MAG: Radical core protein, partial [Acidobacteriota bacterium]|nr:Radical core protein [Acidobacteriota bacterium]